MIRTEGPYSFKGADGLKVPVYIFEPGGERKDVGEATVKVDGGLSFDVVLKEEHQDVSMAVLEVPMRFIVHNEGDV